MIKKNGNKYAALLQQMFGKNVLDIVFSLNTLSLLFVFTINFTINEILTLYFHQHLNVAQIHYLINKPHLNPQKRIQ